MTNSGFKSQTLIGALLYVSLSLSLVSCSNDEVQMQYDGDVIKFSTQVSRATETTLANLSSFKVWAEGEGYTNMFIDGDVATKKSESSSGTNNEYTLARNYYWPADVEKIKFWAYGPYNENIENPSTTDGLTSVAPSVSNVQQNLTVNVNRSLVDGGKNQTDIVVAYSESTNRGAPVALTFNHALSQILINAKSSDATKYVDVKGCWIVNVNSIGTASPATSNPQNNISWSSISNPTTYGVTFSAGKRLQTPTDGQPNLTTDLINGDNSLMLIPQTLTAADIKQSISGAYILIRCRIEAFHAGDQDHVGGHPVPGGHVHQLFPAGNYDKDAYGYTCVAIGTSWKPGYTYVYNLEFFGSSGAGVYPPANLPDDLPAAVERPAGKNPGDPILDNPISFTVTTINNWKTPGNDDFSGNVGM